MIHLSEAQAREFAKLLESYDDDLATLNASKSDTLDDIRQALRKAGLKGADLSAELASFRDAVADHRLARVNPAKLSKKGEKREVSDYYAHLLSREASCTHEGDFSAPAFDRETGEITETAHHAPKESCGGKHTAKVPDRGYASTAGRHEPDVAERSDAGPQDTHTATEGGSPSPILPKQMPDIPTFLIRTPAIGTA